MDLKRVASRWMTALAVVVLGCGTTDSRSGGGTKATQTLGTAGGSVQSSDGKARLDVPEGALTKDTDITLSVMEKEGDTASAIYDFQPDGLEFAKPATLRIRLEASVPEGKKAVLAWYDEEKSEWLDLEGSRTDGQDVVANVVHFTKFAILFRDGQTVVESCTQDINGFHACGGDPTGRWKYQDACLSLPIGGGSSEGCPGMTQTGDIEFVNYSLEFQGGQATSQIDKVVVSITLTLPKSCLMGAPCSAIEQENMTCTDTGAACECVGSQEEIPEQASKTQPYSVSGSTITLGDQTAEFCVQGDELRILQVDEEDGDRVLLIFKRE